MNLKALYQVRGIISQYIKKAELFIQVGLKFVSYLIVFRMISGAEIFSGTGVFNSFGIHLVLALVATLLPSRIGVLIAIALGIYNIFQASLIGAVIVGLMMLMLYVAAARMFPDQVYYLILIPVCIQWNLHLLIPLFAGLYAGIMAVVPVVLGILMWGLIQIIPAFMNLQMGETLDTLPKMISDASSYGIDQITKNEQMMYLLIISAGIVVLVSLLRKLRVDYAHYIALGSGGLLGLVCLIMGKVVGSLPGNLLVLTLLGIVSILGIAFLEFMNLSLNYKAAQNLEFEDEEYYYQVRAIPKINPVSKQKKEVKTITQSGEEEWSKTRVNHWQTAEESRKGRRAGAPSPKRAPAQTPVQSQPKARAKAPEQVKAPARAQNPAGKPVRRDITKDEEIEELFKD